MIVATVLVPAWNEAAVIGRTLAGLAAAGERLRIVVIANACTDDTAAVARQAAPGAVVLETPVPGKCAALNLGLKYAALDLPVVVLDADLQVTADAVLALAAPLAQGEALAACGEMEVSTTGAARSVQCWARAWALNPYFARGKFGGLFALSPHGVARVFPLPAVTADDEYIRRSFLPAEIARVHGCRFVAEAPRTLAALVRVRKRVLRGNQALTARRPPGEGGRALLRAALRHPSRWPDLAVFAGVALWVRLSLAVERRAAVPHWDRDEATRVPRPLTTP
ncbi:glycosyltransferase [Aliigemmobacter aestuarii]|uniref:Glycosyltransferase n=1 Tax=Aliigemmobacter aestuarii TaxID=1445661 RepID=A0A4S3MK23_9RHOB|nr:glycosyltransferase [Gemmobacter aestuarii]THD82302.1 glycosyltransferase [Gemmobacter aestuarii]